MLKNHRLWCMMIKLMNNFTSIHTFDCIVYRARQAVSPIHHHLFHSLLEHLRWKIHDDIVGSHRACQKMCWRKNQHTGIRGQVFAKHGKSTKRASQFDLKLTREKTKSNSRAYRWDSEYLSDGRISKLCRYYRRQKDIKCKRVVKERIGRISRYTKRQNRLLDSRSCMCDKI